MTDPEFRDDFIDETFRLCTSNVADDSLGLTSDIMIIIIVIVISSSSSSSSSVQILQLTP